MSIIPLREALRKTIEAVRDADSSPTHTADHRSLATLDPLLELLLDQIPIVFEARGFRYEDLEIDYD